ncbi:MAG: hypothetical protein ACK5WW_01355 [Brevundimonas sp.]|uniref:hypothetical protein n=1 Tax=Brevundimonas sp. TaxID=1871086 RepID=UPI0022BF412F|nr:hypothetical protein [Brevundimonas sp.]MCZ8193798.1 hypothetical protein [Brevundimonas sp.]
MRKLSGGLAVIAVFVGLAAAPAPAAAEQSADSFLAQFENGTEAERYIAKIQIQSIAAGLAWAIADMQDQGLPRLFCAPERMIITAEQHIDILRRFVDGELSIMKDLPLGLVLLFALKETFPCDAA